MGPMKRTWLILVPVLLGAAALAWVLQRPTPVTLVSPSRGDAIDTVTADDELHGLNRFIRQSRRLPIRSRTSCGPRIISQDTVD